MIHSYVSIHFSFIRDMTERWAPKKPNFGPPPAGYVPGYGRGAIGFVTRSDIGPGKIPAVDNVNTNEVNQDNYQAGQFDNWEGQKGALFSKGNLDGEDKQAEDAYDFCEKRVWERGEKKRKQAQEKAKNEENQDHSLTGKFVDLKRDLAKVSNEEWETIPDCVDLSIKKRKKDKFAPVPDSLLVGAIGAKDGIKAIDPDQQNVDDFRQAKETFLKSKLDNLENNVDWRSKIDKLGYMTELDTKKIDAELLADTKRARMLYHSALTSNPKNSDIWLAAARVQKLDGKLNQCRNLLRKAVEALPLCDDLWVELSIVEKHDLATDVLLEGLRYLPSSEKLWLYAARREQADKEKMSKILRRGLEQNPQSIRLWRELIELEDVEEAKKLLYRAVEALPRQIDLWLALAKSEDYKNAKYVLNKARKSNPLNLEIWICAIRLQETQAKVESVGAILGKIQNITIKGRQILKKNGANISRQQWLQQAFYAEKSESFVVSEVLVKISVNYGLTEDQFHNVLVKDVQLYEKQKQANHTTRFLYLYGIKLTKSSYLMKEMIEFENRKKMNKEYNELDKTLKFALEMFGNQKQFWKTTIVKLIKEAQTSSALAMIQSALPKINENDEEQIRLLRVNVYMIQQEYEKAREELQQLRVKFPKGQCIFQSIRFQYEIEIYKEAWLLCQKYFKESKSQKIWKLAFRIKRKIGNYAESHAIIEKAISLFPDSVSTWRDFIQMEVEEKHVSRARALIDRAIQKMPKCVELYIMSIELERKLGSKKEANFALSKSLKMFPKNPQIWAIAVELEPQNTRKKKAVSAIEVCGESAWISSSGGKLFWKQNKLDKAKKWLESALRLSPNNGDIWALYIRLLECYFEKQKEDAISRMLSVEEQMVGRKWKQVEESRGGWKLQPIQILTMLMREVDGEIKAL